MEMGNHVDCGLASEYYVNCQREHLQEKEIIMSKKNYDVASTSQGRALAEKNAQFLADAFAALGVKTKIETETPTWESRYENVRPKTITTVTLFGFFDEEGYPCEFMFGHNDGRILPWCD